MYRFSCVLFFLLFSNQTVNAFEKLSFDIETLVTSNWKIKGAKLSLSDLYNNKQQFRATIKQLVLPEPFSNLKIFNITCLSFSWQSNKVVCQKGKARVKSSIIASSSFKFSFFISEKKSQFTLSGLPLAKGKLSLTVLEKNGHWLVSAKSKNIELQQFASLLKKKKPIIDEGTSGIVDADIKLTGTNNGLDTLLIHSIVNKLSFQAEKGHIATELLGFDFDLQAIKKNGEWNWKHTGFVRQGEVYIEPIYIEIKEEERVTVQVEGLLRKKNEIVLQKANITIPDISDINIEGIIKIRPFFDISKAKIQAKIKNLNYFSTHYFSALAEQTVLEGINLKGQLDLNVEVSDSAIRLVSSKLSNFTLFDLDQRIEIINSSGEINWSDDSRFDSPSNIQWDKLNIRAIPFDTGNISLLLSGKTIKLLQSTDIPVLDGLFSIIQFNWQHNIDDEPTVYFEGGIKNISLERLTQVLDWTPLTGNISGYIPGVQYKNKVLKVNGELKVDVFDGTIGIDKLALSGLLTDIPRLYLDIKLDNLDLHAITQQFEMGGVEGRLSGYVNNLFLENWEPVTFYAWFGTPKNDDSRHRISQKAVENIASIGGGGAADIISKGFLRFFDTFRYDRLGFGCYLYQGVCQLMGVEATKQGYYIIKGGGLPRIDVIGYNPRVDWKVLIQRLSRISDTDNLIIE
ncbi:MAG: C4-dicarboxylate ABC transporter [Methylococcales bacterium]|nr:C4-dicarboxylate ABC transporter [Methylococcales bacterium]